MQCSNGIRLTAIMAYYTIRKKRYSYMFAHTSRYPFGLLHLYNPQQNTKNQLAIKNDNYTTYFSDSMIEYHFNFKTLSQRCVYIKMNLLSMGGSALKYTVRCNIRSYLYSLFHCFSQNLYFYRKGVSKVTAIFCRNKSVIKCDGASL